MRQDFVPRWTRTFALCLSLLLTTLQAKAAIKPEIPSHSKEDDGPSLKTEEVMVDDSEGSVFDEDNKGKGLDEDGSNGVKDGDEDKGHGKSKKGVKKDFDKYSPEKLKIVSFKSHLDEISFCGPDMSSVLGKIMSFPDLKIISFGDLIETRNFGFLQIRKTLKSFLEI